MSYQLLWLHQVTIIYYGYYRLRDCQNSNEGAVDTGAGWEVVVKVTFVTNTCYLPLHCTQ